MGIALSSAPFFLGMALSNKERLAVTIRIGQVDSVIIRVSVLAEAYLVWHSWLRSGNTDAGQEHGLQEDGGSPAGNDVAACRQSGRVQRLTAPNSVIKGIATAGVHSFAAAA